MEFRNEMQKNVYIMVASWFEPELQSGAIQRYEDQPAFFARGGSAGIRISILPYGDDEAVINVLATVVKGASLTPELMGFLLATNRDSCWFGAFGFDSKSDSITFEHSIVGSTCDRKELQTSMVAVLGAADKYDDMIVAKFGGKSLGARESGQ